MRLRLTAPFLVRYFSQMCRCTFLPRGWRPGLGLVFLAIFASPRLVAQVASGDAESGGFQQKFADPAFRLRASRPDQDLSEALELLKLKESDQPHLYEWLQHEAKGVKEQSLECRLLSWLARQLHRPSEEILKADDLALQAAPDAVDSWLNRAETYAAEKEAEKSVWALDTYLQALRRLDLSTMDWRKVLQRENAGTEVWLQRAQKAGKLSAWGDALADVLRNTPRGEARLESADLLLDFLNNPEVKAQPALAEGLLDTLADVQPLLPLGAVSRFIDTLKSYEAAGQHGVSRRMGRLLILAPIPKEAAVEGEPVAQAPSPATTAAPVDALAAAQQEIEAEKQAEQWDQAKQVRAGYHTLSYCWENTLPRYQPQTLARVVLAAAMGDDGPALAKQCLALAKEQPWNESLLSHALLATALTDVVHDEDLEVAASLSITAKGRLAQRLCAFAPLGNYPLTTVGSWLEDGAKALIQEWKGKSVDRAYFDSLLLTLDWLERAGQSDRLHHLLRASLETPPRALDITHWERFSKLILSHGSSTDVKGFAEAWRSALGRAPVEKDHLLSIAEAAVKGGPDRGKEFATLALEIWQRQYGGEFHRNGPDAGAASKVAEGLLAAEDMDDFGTFLEGLEKVAKSGNFVFRRMADELSALRDLLTGKGDHLPAVDAWVQSPATPDKPARVQWQFVLPELDPQAGMRSPIHITLGSGREAAADTGSDARWWAAGTPHPMLQQLAGRYNLEILAGEEPDKLHTFTTVSGAVSAGYADLPRLPLAGYLRMILRDPASSAVAFGPSRLFSLRPPLFSTGTEPEAASEVKEASAIKLDAQPAPPSWQKEDVERWGRMVNAPIPIEEGADYVVTDWPRRLALAADPDAAKDQPLPVQLILLDAKFRPLGPVPVASTGLRTEAATIDLYSPSRAHAQLFRPSDWSGDGDVVRPRMAEDTEEVARYMVFITRAPGEGALPLLQLRPYREYAPGSSSHSLGETIEPPMPELNGEFIAAVGFRPRAWHVTMATDRAVFTGKGAMAGLDVSRIPWKPLVRVESDLLEGTEWPMCFQAGRAILVEPSWSGNRSLGYRFVPFTPQGSDYANCERHELPLPTYDRGEISPRQDGALLMVSSRRGTVKPEPMAAWIEPDGKCTVVPLPRPPLKGNPGLIVAWWGPEEKFTLHEDGILFHMQHLDGLRLLKAEPGSPDDIPEGAEPGKSLEKPHWVLERPDVLAEHDTVSGAFIRRFHLTQACEGKPMSFHHSNPVMLFTKDKHDIIRVNPPPKK